ncbi:hypothetical protein LO55_5060 [Massilia timonae]|uniref:Uncharacterized protein n=2 Tax=Massilia timonae TaxID=47229 RepID=A0A1S2N909_9BURK|nr:hypothetical protein LO55_5060 [Massilia timonae]
MRFRNVLGSELEIEMTKQWDDEYLKGAFADEIALAKLHPKWRRTFKAPTTLTLDAPLVHVQRTSTFGSSATSPRLTFSTVAPQVPPHWRRSWMAAGPLSTELGLSVRHDQDDGTVSVGVGGGRRNVTEAYADHPNADAAAMAAIVRAAIQRLTELRDAH